MNYPSSIWKEHCNSGTNSNNSFGFPNINFFYLANLAGSFLRYLWLLSSRGQHPQGWILINFNMTWVPWVQIYNISKHDANYFCSHLCIYCLTWKLYYYKNILKSFSGKIGVCKLIERSRLCFLYVWSMDMSIFFT